MLSLDVGCGSNPKGDVNCDLYVGKTFHSFQFINPRTIPNFVRCDVNALPFKENSFGECFCFAVLEHKGVKPIKVIKEMVRVTNGTIYIRVPHRFHDRLHRTKCHIEGYGHVRTFNVKTVQELLRRLGLACQIKVVYKCFPHILFCLIRLSWFIDVKIYCNKLV